MPKVFKRKTLYVALAACLGISHVAQAAPTQVGSSEYFYYYDATSTTQGADDYQVPNGDTVTDSITAGTDATPDTVSYNGYATIYGIRFAGAGSYGSAENPPSMSLTVKNSGTSGTNSSIRLYGLYSASDTINNNGSIELKAEGGTVNANANANANTYGISGNVGTNNGAITVTANGGTASASNATADVTATATAAGIWGGVGTNAGDITVMANGGGATNSSTAQANANADAYAYAYAYAAANACGIDGNVTENNGAITVTANGGIADADADANADADADADAYINATAYANATAYGIDGNVGTNKGDITVRAQGGAADAYAYADAGAYADAYAYAYADAYAYGISGDVGTNKGDITVRAQGGAADADAYAYAYAYADAYADAYAYGISGDVGTNNGDITVSATAGKISTDGGTSYTSDDATAYGLHIDSGTGTVTNTGTIEATANAHADYDGTGSINAYGAYFQRNATFHSSGLISAQANGGASSSAYQVYANGSAVTITGYALDFTGDQAAVDAEYNNAMGVESNGTITFFGATLYAYGAPTQETYVIPTLYDSDGDGDLTDEDNHYFTSVDDSNISVDYDASAILSTDTSTPQTVTFDLTYAPQASVVGSAEMVVHSMKSLMSGIAMHNLKGVYMGVNSQRTGASSGDGYVTSGSNYVFVEPFATRLESSAKPMGFDADIYGLTAGYDSKVNEHLTAGFYVGYGNSDINYTGTGYEQRGEDIEMLSVGGQMVYEINPDLFMTGTLDFTFTDNDYADNASNNIESANYKGWTSTLAADLNKVYRYGKHKVVPRIGLSYTHYDTDAFTTEGTNVRYDGISEDELTLQAGVDWYGHTESQSSWTIQPKVGLGINQILTDGEFTSTLTAGSGPAVTVNTEADKTQLTAQASVRYDKDDLGIILGYEGAYGDDTKNHTIYMDVQYRF